MTTHTLATGREASAADADISAKAAASEAGMPASAIVLAAGLGKRMRPLTETRPKPLVEVAGKPLIDHGLDALARAGVAHAVVNTHYLADQLVEHVERRAQPEIRVSDERDLLLDSGGGVARALPLAQPGPVLLLNADTFWIDAPGIDNLQRLAASWDEERMDILVLLAPLAASVGHTGRGDFGLAGKETRAGPIARAVGGHVYAGAAILSPSIFRGDEAEVHSLNLHFDRAIEAGRLYGVMMDGLWLTVGTPEAIGEAERAIAAYQRDTGDGLA